MSLFLVPGEQRKCPKCSLISSIKHCKSATCNWWQCNGASCVVVGTVLVFASNSYFYAPRSRK